VTRKGFLRFDPRLSRPDSASKPNHRKPRAWPSASSAQIHRSPPANPPATALRPRTAVIGSHSNLTFITGSGSFADQWQKGQFRSFIKVKPSVSAGRTGSRRPASYGCGKEAVRTAPEPHSNSPSSMVGPALLGGRGDYRDFGVRVDLAAPLAEQVQVTGPYCSDLVSAVRCGCCTAGRDTRSVGRVLREP
jgi:hypothetical protein